MTLMEFFGCTFISFGPCLALFTITIARDPLRVIVMIASGFFWLLSLLMSSVLWYAVVPLRNHLAFGLVFSVIFQEIFRFLFYKLMRKANDGLLTVSQNNRSTPSVSAIDVSNRHILAYVSGVGYGLLYGAFSFVNILADMSGPGTIGIHGDSQYFFIVSAFLTQFFILLHITWSVILFYAFDHRKYHLIALVVGSHIFVSCLTLLNQSRVESDTHPNPTQSHPLYLATIIPAYLTLVVNGVVAFYIAGGTCANLMVQLPPSMTYTRMTSQCVLHARKQVRLHMKRIRQREYCKLRDMVPALAHKKKVDKVTVIEEAVRYIDELHRALAERLQQKSDAANMPEITQDNVKYFVQQLMVQQFAHKQSTSPVLPSNHHTSHSTHVSTTSYPHTPTNTTSWSPVNYNPTDAERHS